MLLFAGPGLGPDGQSTGAEPGSPGEVRIPFLRQQIRKREGRANMCLADFIRADGDDWIGGFAVGIHGIDAHIARIEASMKTETNVLLRETLARDLEAAAREAREQVQWTCERGRTPRASGERQRVSSYRGTACPALS